MILFRRVSSAFKGIEGREWALLALETLGVVAGIMIAFELNEWASQRSDASKHRQLMERLFEESELDIISLREKRDILRTLVKGEIDFATRLGKGECPPEPMWNAVGTVAMLPALVAPRSVYNELLAAGGISSIEDSVVRREISTFNASLEGGEKQIDYFRMVKEDPVTDSDPRIRVSYDPSAEEPSVETYDREALCRDPAFRNRMASATRQHWVMMHRHEEVTENAIYMCGVIGESIGRRCNPTYGGQLSPDDKKALGKAIAEYRKPHS